MNNKIGIDIVSIERLKNKSDDFLRKILHSEEYNFYMSLTSEDRQFEFLAGRWCAKEAIFKAFNHSYNSNNILIGNFNSVPKILEPSDLKHISVSISHDNGFAIAVAIENF